MYLVSINKLGIPQNSIDAFEVLYKNNVISQEILKRIKGMMGFRNIAVHNYQEINLMILQKIIENHLDDFEEFINNVNK
ncbi:hypothetical protein GCM10008932_24140 [Alkalibacterium iburiense]|uniref:DUF86 domain-containing protein n=1 Tax=Alkalibacterium iburiense TaxID=290589 RepID=A0ABN0XST7_9LACT